MGEHQVPRDEDRPDRERTKQPEPPGRHRPGTDELIGEPKDRPPGPTSRESPRHTD